MSLHGVLQDRDITNCGINKNQRPANLLGDPVQPGTYRAELQEAHISG